jgi:hypothetical protein
MKTIKIRAIRVIRGHFPISTVARGLPGMLTC